MKREKKEEKASRKEARNNFLHTIFYMQLITYFCYPNLSAGNESGKLSFDF